MNLKQISKEDEYKYEEIKNENLEARCKLGALGGCRKTYRVFNSQESYFVVADYAVTADRGPETMIFMGDEDGKVIDWGDLWSWPGDAVTDDYGIRDYVGELNFNKYAFQIVGQAREKNTLDNGDA